MRLAAPSALVLAVASVLLASACQLDYEIVESDGLAGSGSDLVGIGGGSPGNTGGGSGVGGTAQSSGGLGGEGSGGADSGGAPATTGGTTGSGGTGSGGVTGSGGASGGSDSGGSGGGSGGSNPVLTVTTSDDEEDAGATPSSPGGDGFSLREAILYANLEVGPNDVVFQSNYTINLGSPLPTITESANLDGAVGSNTVLIQGAGAGSSAPCISVMASDVVIDTFFIFDCPSAPVSFQAGSGSGNMMTNCFVSSSGTATFYGDAPVVLFNYWNSPDSVAIAVYGTDAEILANRVENAAGAAIYVDDAADDAFLLANVTNSAAIGIDLRAQDGARLWHNTIVQSDGDGISLTGTTGVDMRNNIVSGSALFGVDGSNAQFSSFDYNLYFDNTSGNCSTCTLQANDLTSDPVLDSDHGPQTGSPAIDSGVDLGDDRNLDDPGLFNGAAPDRGYIETP